MLVSTVADVAVGALLLATTAVLTLQVWRHATTARAEEIAMIGRQPIGLSR